jgi:hypothetical protein
MDVALQLNSSKKCNSNPEQKCTFHAIHSVLGVSIYESDCDGIVPMGALDLVCPKHQWVAVKCNNPPTSPRDPAKEACIAIVKHEISGAERIIDCVQEPTKGSNLCVWHANKSIQFAKAKMENPPEVNDAKIFPKLPLCDLKAQTNSHKRHHKTKNVKCTPYLDAAKAAKKPSQPHQKRQKIGPKSPRNLSSSSRGVFSGRESVKRAEIVPYRTISGNSSTSATSDDPCGLLEEKWTPLEGKWEDLADLVGDEAF